MDAEDAIGMLRRAGRNTTDGEVTVPALVYVTSADYRLRYGPQPMAREDLLFVASVCSAYAELCRAIGTDLKRARRIARLARWTEGSDA